MESEAFVLADSAVQFLRDLKQLVPREQAGTELRSTPRGVFVHKDYCRELVELYRGFLGRLSHGEADIGFSKCMRRLFGSEEPELFYLVEQKRCMVGSLVPYQQKQPELLGIPTYLGSLSDCADSIHPRDPFLLCVPNLQVQASAQGMRFEFKLDQRSFVFDSAALKTFAAVLGRSESLRSGPSREHGGANPAMRDSLRTVIELLPRLRPVEDDMRLLLPFEALRSKKQSLKIWRLQGLVVLTSRLGEITGIYESEGLNLFYFLKSEWQALKKSQVLRAVTAIQPVHSKDSEHLGSVLVHGRKHMLGEQALVDFVKLVIAKAPGEPDNWRRFSIIECLNLLLDLVMRAEPVPTHQIERCLKTRRQRTGRHLVNARWIFTVANGSVITAVIDRATAPDHKPRRTGVR